eukprot:m.20880 g.20880  ORF g.20880 m.20880 type:complete len:411 (+) comp3570_c0_seq1:90-1322(+)
MDEDSAHGSEGMPSSGTCSDARSETDIFISHLETVASLVPEQEMAAHADEFVELVESELRKFHNYLLGTCMDCHPEPPAKRIRMRTRKSSAKSNLPACLARVNAATCSTCMFALPAAMKMAFQVCSAPSTDPAPTLCCSLASAWVSIGPPGASSAYAWSSGAWVVGEPPGARATWFNSIVCPKPAYAVLISAIDRMLAAATAATSSPESQSHTQEVPGKQQPKIRFVASIILKWLILAARNTDKLCSEWWRLLGDLHGVYWDSAAFDELITRLNDPDSPAIYTAYDTLTREISAFNETERAVMRTPRLSGALIRKFCYSEAVTTNHLNFRARSHLCDALEALAHDRQNTYYDTLTQNDILLSLKAVTQEEENILAQAGARDSRMRKNASRLKPVTPPTPNKWPRGYLDSA